MFLFIKWLHVLAAILAFGSNLTYAVWLALASRSPEHLPFTLRSIQWIDNRLANPGYGVLLITGLIMAFITDLPLTTPWLLTALVLYALTALSGILFYAPAFRRQIQVLEKEGPDSPAYRAADRKATRLGMFLVLLALGIVYLMVVKPALWGG